MKQGTCETAGTERQVAEDNAMTLLYSAECLPIYYVMVHTSGVRVFIERLIEDLLDTLCNDSL